MAQSQKELKELNISERQRKKSNQMALTKQEMMELDPEEVFEWEVEKLDEGLKELDVTIGKGWTKSKKANELNKVLLQNASTSQPKMSDQTADPSLMMFQAFQADSKHNR